MKPLIIPIFIPNLGCKHNCIFCNQTSITNISKKIPSSEEIKKAVLDFLNYKKNRNPIEIAFFGGNFLGLNQNEIKFLLCEAQNFIRSNQVDFIRFSTRPDTITPEILEFIQNFSISTIELGVQSMNDNVLILNNRGHTKLDTYKAFNILKKQNYKIGVQLMTGLYGDNQNSLIQTAQEIIKLNPDFVRIYPTVVLKNTLLASLYKSGKYKPLELEESINLVKEIYKLFAENKILVIRMGLQDSEHFKDSILAGPYHPSFGHLVYSKVFLDMLLDNINNLKLQNISNISNLAGQKIIIKTHPKNISKIRGLKNQNLEIIKNKFDIKEIEIIGDAEISEPMLICI